MQSASLRVTCLEKVYDVIGNLNEYPTNMLSSTGIEKQVSGCMVDVGLLECGYRVRKCLYSVQVKRRYHILPTIHCY